MFPSVSTSRTGPYIRSWSFRTVVGSVCARLHHCPSYDQLKCRAFFFPISAWRRAHCGMCYPQVFTEECLPQTFSWPEQASKPVDAHSWLLTQLDLRTRAVSSCLFSFFGPDWWFLLLKAWCLSVFLYRDPGFCHLRWSHALTTCMASIRKA